MTKNNELTEEQIAKAYARLRDVPVLKEEEKVEYDKLLDSKVTLRNAINIAQYLISPINFVNSAVREHNDVIDVLLNKHLKITEKEWKETEDKVKDMNEKAKKSAAEQLRKELNEDRTNKATKEGKGA